ncbi:MAG: hypothetical protein CME62_16075 [Halobacteriovoraceae bacterium]|nr:hypothetical protein [Halobacteriovoraceae bacterium]|tara:strand:- start:112 stop:1104 length:993 start_codon:yes stop_codon:yes gene_type:complete
MKSALAALTLVATTSAFACVGYGDQQVCQGDTVLIGTAHSQGYKVIGIDRRNNEFIAKDNYYNTLSTKSFDDIYYNKGCYNSICVGDKIYKGTSFAQGAKVLGYNIVNKKYLVKDNYYSTLSTQNRDTFYLPEGCNDYICVGDTVYKGTSFAQGAKVVAMSIDSNHALVKDNYYSTQSVQRTEDLIVTQETSKYSSYERGQRYIEFLSEEPIQQQQVYSTYVFDFRGASKSIADRTINLVKALEPYINNANEAEMDNIKKKAARLLARANTNDMIKLTTTAQTLDDLLVRNEAYLFELVETDALDGMAIELITISEELKALIDYLASGQY